LILRTLLDHAPVPPTEEQDLYLYNIAPDNLPLTDGFRSRDTHRFEPPPGALEYYPKLIWVKCHLIVDNFCHYGAISKPAESLAITEKAGYTYKRGADIVPLFIEYAGEMNVPLGESDALYLAHTMVEIAVDYAISQDDRTVPTIIRRARKTCELELIEEYEGALAALYGRKSAEIAATNGAAEKFYGDVDNIDFMYLDGRTRIVLRKLKLPFSDENVARTRQLILDSAEKVSDYPDFIRDSVELFTDRAAWAGAGAITGAAE